MKIRKAALRDLNDYLNLKKESLKEYFKISGINIDLTNKQIKKELFEAIKNPKRFLLFLEEKKIEGYLIGSLIISDNQDYGYIDDIFISRNFRKKGFGTKLIKEFMKILKLKKVKNFRLGVNIKNKNAISLYKKLGFVIKHYEMDKRLK